MYYQCYIFLTSLTPHVDIVLDWIPSLMGTFVHGKESANKTACKGSPVKLEALFFYRYNPQSALCQFSLCEKDSQAKSVHVYSQTHSQTAWDNSIIKLQENLEGVKKKSNKKRSKT